MLCRIHWCLNQVDNAKYIDVINIRMPACSTWTGCSSCTCTLVHLALKVASHWLHGYLGLVNTKFLAHTSPVCSVTCSSIPSWMMLIIGSNNGSHGNLWDKPHPPITEVTDNPFPALSLEKNLSTPCHSTLPIHTEKQPNRQWVGEGHGYLHSQL